jgi:regulatory protein
MIRPTRRTRDIEDMEDSPAPLAPVQMSDHISQQAKPSSQKKSNFQRDVDAFEVAEEKSHQPGQKSSFGKAKSKGFKAKPPKAKTESKNTPQREQGPKVPRQMTESRVRNISEYYVSQRDCSQHMLRTMLTNRLRRRAFTQDAEAAEIEKIEAEELFEAEIVRLVGLGVINDARYAEGRARSWLGQGRAQRRILMELARKGIDSDIAQEAILSAARETTGQYSEDFQDEIVAEAAEWEAAETLARKRRIGPYRTTLAPQTRDEVAKLWRREAGKMARAGFGMDIICQILNRKPDCDDNF